MSYTNEVTLEHNTGWDERILVCRNGTLVQCFVILTARFTVVVDTMLNPATALKMLRLAGAHRPNGRRLLVINTHADFDHSWGNQLFGPGAMYEAPIIGQHLCAERFRSLRAAEYLLQMQREEPAHFSGVTLTAPNFLFSERLTIDGGDLTLELMHTPGHTPDHVSLYIPQIATLLAGDAAELPFPFAQEAASLMEMRASLARLAALGAEQALYCHAPASCGPRLLQDNIAYFDYLEQCCRQALANGAPADPEPEVDVIELVGCTYEQATPAGEEWQQVHSYYRTEGHAQQIRMMLQALAGSIAG